MRSIYFNGVAAPAIPALQQLSDGIALNGLLDAIRAKPVTYEALFTKKMDSLFIWSYEDFLDGLRADYSDQGSIRHMAELGTWQKLIVTKHLWMLWKKFLILVSTLC